ncbi:MAG: pilus assembly protein TadG-related protein [Desulfotomaculales bacterium]
MPGKPEKKIFRDERGGALVLVAVAMLCLLGFGALVTDVGLYTLTRQQLVNAADAAALAGAAELSPAGSGEEAAALQTARDYAVKNGADPAELEVSVGPGPGGGKAVRVDAGKKVDFVLARLFGVSSGTVRASASAAVAGVTACRGVAPLLIAKQDFRFGAKYTLKYGDPAYPGNFGALALGGKGADVFRRNLIYGYSGEIAVGDMVTTEPGNMTGPTQAIDQRLSLCTRNCTVDNFEPGCPKILIVPVYEPDGSLHGRSEVRVAGFAAFLADRTDAQKDEIEGYFISMAVPGRADFAQPPSYGLYAVRIIR